MSASSSGAGGASSSTAGSATSSSGTTSASSGAGGAPPSCVGSIDVVVDNGPLQHWPFECQGELYANQEATAIGYLFAAAGSTPNGLKLVGCATATLGSVGAALYVFNASSVGDYPTGVVKYVDGNGKLWGTMGDPFDVAVTTLGPLGAPIEGTFSASSSKNNVVHTLSGTFHVCRAADYP